MRQDPGFLKLRKIRAAQKIAKTISESQNRVYLPANGLMLNVGEEGYLKVLDKEGRRR